MIKERNINLDIIRSVAVFLTVCRHAIINSGIYDVSINGIVPFFTAMLAVFTASCVPLFLMLFGYLCNRKSCL